MLVIAPSSDAPVTHSDVPKPQMTLLKCYHGMECLFKVTLRSSYHFKHYSFYIFYMQRSSFKI